MQRDECWVQPNVQFGWDVAAQEDQEDVDHGAEQHPADVAGEGRVDELSEWVEVGVVRVADDTSQHLFTNNLQKSTNAFTKTHTTRKNKTKQNITNPAMRILADTSTFEATCLEHK